MIENPSSSSPLRGGEKHGSFNRARVPPRGRKPLIRLTVLQMSEKLGEQGQDKKSIILLAP